MAFSLTAIIGAAALAVDLSYVYTERNRLQIAADAAALAGAQALPDADDVRAAALDFAARNMPAEAHGTVLDASDVEIGSWDAASRTFTIGATPANAVRVTTGRNASNGNSLGLFFGQVLGIASLDLTTSAVAGGGGTPICILALHPGSSDSLTLNSNAGIDADGCNIQVNSSNSQALTTDSNATVSAAHICVTGNYQEGGGSSIAPAPETGCPVIVDPLADLDPPSYGGCDYTNAVYDNYSGSLEPGVYCGGLEINGNSTVTFNPGTYVIKDANFYVDSNSIIQGDGVAFYLTNGALIEFNSDVQASFKAPTTGELAGIIFFQDRNDSGIHRFDSNNTNMLEGTVYLPNGVLKSDSNSRMGGDSAFTMYIALRFDFNSNAGLAVNSDYESSDVPLPAGLSIVYSLLD